MDNAEKIVNTHLHMLNKVAATIQHKFPAEMSALCALSFFLGNHYDSLVKSVAALEKLRKEFLPAYSDKKLGQQEALHHYLGRWNPIHKGNARRILSKKELLFYQANGMPLSMRRKRVFHQ